MPLPSMRPSFVLKACCRPDDVMDALRSRLDGNPQGVEASFSRKHAVLCMPAENRRFWSPCLDLTIDGGDGDGDGGAPGESDPAEGSTEVWGTYGPRPEIWTGFVFAIGTLTIVATLSLFFGIAQIMLGHTPWALAIPLGALVLAVVLYFSALFGQNLSLQDMYQMRAYLDASLDAAQRPGAEIATRGRAPKRPGDC